MFVCRFHFERGSGAAWLRGSRDMDSSQVSPVRGIHDPSHDRPVGSAWSPKQWVPQDFTSCAHTLTPSQHHEPQRLSALYQYHNAPEVAPAHGLEYDDTIYPSSDKYPVMREHAYDGKHMGKYAFVNDNRPPRIIFGMKLPTFLIVATIMILVVVGAAVGGAVGGHQLRENQSQTQAG